MKRLTALTFALLLIFSGFSSLSAQQQSLDKVMEAMSISMGAYFMAAMMSGMGSTPQGIEFDQNTGNMTFSNFDVTDMTDVYTSLSGTVKGTEAAGYDFDFSLRGGPISTIRYSLTEEEMQNQPDKLVIYADGKKYEVPLTGDQPLP